LEEEGFNTRLLIKGGAIEPPMGRFARAVRRSPTERLVGRGWRFNPAKDIDWRGTTRSYRDALEEAFRRTGVEKEKFRVTAWGRDANGKTIPTEWTGPRGAQVNMDIPDWNLPDGGMGPVQPHIGYQTPGRGADKVRGHIFVDEIPATRR